MDTQTGFIQGRLIGENARFICDIINYTELNNILGLVMLINFEKAFDSISWSLIVKVLEFTWIGKYIIDWVKILNINFKTAIMQSGYLSDQFSIQRGCRQGGPGAPYLFILSSEILSFLIKQRNKR